jgi:ribosome biogenesis protein NSA1
MDAKHHLIATGTKAGTVRRYDTRQRKPLDDWKVAKEGGIGCIEAGKDEQYVHQPADKSLSLMLLSELFFADRSSTLGALDLRTGRVLYTFSNISATPHYLLSIPSSPAWQQAEQEAKGPRFGLASLASDATIRLHATNPPPIDNPKQNVSKGAIVSHAGGVGLGDILYMGPGEVVEHEVITGETESKDEQEEEDEVWEKMEDVEDGSEDGSEGDLTGSEESDSEEEPVKSKRARK